VKKTSAVQLLCRTGNGDTLCFGDTSFVIFVASQMLRRYGHLICVSAPSVAGTTARDNLTASGISQDSVLFVGDWNLQDWKMTRQIPPLRLRPSFSSPANSTPANSAIPFLSVQCTALRGWGHQRQHHLCFNAVLQMNLCYEWMNENARILSAFENRLRAGFV